MNCNVGGIDRALRVVAGIGIIAWGVLSENMWGAVGLVPLITGLVKFCPLYLMLGLKTCKVENANNSN